MIAIIRPITDCDIENNRNSNIDKNLDKGNFVRGAQCSSNGSGFNCGDRNNEYYIDSKIEKYKNKNTDSHNIENKHTLIMTGSTRKDT